MSESRFDTLCFDDGDWLIARFGMCALTSVLAGLRVVTKAFGTVYGSPVLQVMSSVAATTFGMMPGAVSHFWRAVLATRYAAACHMAGCRYGICAVEGLASVIHK
jgi:hypothetical protein